MHWNASVMPWNVWDMQWIWIRILVLCISRHIHTWTDVHTNNCTSCPDMHECWLLRECISPDMYMHNRTFRLDLHTNNRTSCSDMHERWLLCECISPDLYKDRFFFKIQILDMNTCISGYYPASYPDFSISPSNTGGYPLHSTTFK